MCRFGQGATDRASYTRIGCQVRRDRGTFGVPSLGALPDADDVGAIPTSFVGIFFPRFKQETMENLEIWMITPRNLQRF